MLDLGDADRRICRTAVRARAGPRSRGRGAADRDRPSARRDRARLGPGLGSGSRAAATRSTRSAPDSLVSPAAPLRVGDRGSDSLERGRVGAEQEADPAGRVGVGDVALGRAAAAARPARPDRAVISSAKESALASIWRESWLPGMLSANAAIASAERVGGQRGRRAGVGAGARGQALAETSRANSRPSGATMATKPRPRRMSSWAHVAELVGDHRRAARPGRRRRSGCRRAPPAWSGRARPT